MALHPNAPGERRGGRKRGVPNRVTGALKDRILAALDAAGGEAYLLRMAQEEPRAFLALVGRLIPQEARVTSETGLELVVCRSYGSGSAGRS